MFGRSRATIVTLSTIVLITVGISYLAYVILRSPDSFHQTSTQDIANLYQTNFALMPDTLPLHKDMAGFYLQQGRIVEPVLMWRAYLGVETHEPSRQAALQELDGLGTLLVNQFDSVETSSCGGDCIEIQSFCLRSCMRAIYQHPTSEITYTLPISPQSTLIFGTALNPEIRGKPSDGVQFEVYQVNSGARTLLFSEFLAIDQIDFRRAFWLDWVVDIAPTTEQATTLVFATAPGPANDDRYDWAGWVEPMIVGPQVHDFLGD